MLASQHLPSFSFTQYVEYSSCFRDLPKAPFPLLLVFLIGKSPITTS